MSRFILDIRCGCAAVRDTKHPKYDKDYPGLHKDTCDVVEYRHGFQNHEKGCWEMKEEDIQFLKDYCDSLNEVSVNCSADGKLILLNRINPTEYEIHRSEIRQKANLILTTTDKEFAERLVNGYNKQQCINKSLLREMIYLLTLKQPDNCPSWKCGVGDCDNPGCEFCRIQRCIDKLESQLNDTPHHI